MSWSGSSGMLFSAKTGEHRNERIWKAFAYISASSSYYLHENVYREKEEILYFQILFLLQFYVFMLCCCIWDWQAPHDAMRCPHLPLPFATPLSFVHSDSMHIHIWGLHWGEHSWGRVAGLLLSICKRSAKGVNLLLYLGASAWTCQWPFTKKPHWVRSPSLPHYQHLMSWCR